MEAYLKWDIFVKTFVLSSEAFPSREFVCILSRERNSSYHVFCRKSV